MDYKIMVNSVELIGTTAYFYVIDEVLHKLIMLWPGSALMFYNNTLKNLLMEDKIYVII